jgi:hypothetical protein
VALPEFSAIELSAANAEEHDTAAKIRPGMSFFMIDIS